MNLRIRSFFNGLLAPCGDVILSPRHRRRQADLARSHREMAIHRTLWMDFELRKSFGAKRDSMLLRFKKHQEFQQKARSIPRFHGGGPLKSGTGSCTIWWRSGEFPSEFFPRLGWRRECLLYSRGPNFAAGVWKRGECSIIRSFCVNHIGN